MEAVFDEKRDQSGGSGGIHPTIEHNQMDFLSIFVGTVVGGVTALFLNTLAYGTEKAAEWPYYYLFMPIAFFLSSWMVLRFAPDAAGHGTEKVIESIHKKMARSM